MFKVICLDLDGTLLDDNKTISDLNARVLEFLYSKGIEIVIATGRGMNKARELTSKIKFPYKIIANNGAIAGYSYKNDIIFYNPIEYDLYNTIFETGKVRKMIPYLHIFEKNGEKSLVIPNNEKKEEHMGSVNKIDEILFANETDRELLDGILSVVYIDKEDKIDRLGEEILKLKLKLSTHTLSSVRENAIMLEYLNPLAEKSIGISAYLKYRNISWNNVISFGDDNNDLDMIRRSGMGICMRNGTESLKINAKYITAYGNNESGVGRELIKIFGGIYGAEFKRLF